MELAILSGKGGTGKTMIAAALSELNGYTEKADCDVDAPNLYLYYEGQDIKKEHFSASSIAQINGMFCTRCGTCEAICRFDAIHDFQVDAVACIGCGACVLACPEKAITLRPQKNADVYLTRTQQGMLSRAHMTPGSDGSGKLITQLRKNAQKYVEDDGLLILDGSPGIGCPVISSVTAADIALLVAEPTRSGLEDFIRIAELIRHFGITTFACVNRFDINPAITAEIENYCHENGIACVGRIPFDETVVRSINECRPITDYPDSAACAAIREMWPEIRFTVEELRRKKMQNIDDSD